MAALAVFFIPEILEDIILRVAYQATSDAQLQRDDRCQRWLGDRQAHQLEPVAAIARLARVHRSFRDTIQGSPKLQRALSGGPLTSSPDPLHRSRLLPLKWLTEHAIKALVCENFYDYPRTNDTVHIETHFTKHRIYFNDFVRSHGKHLEASWRQVKVLSGGDDNCTEVRLNVLFRRPKGYNGPRYYTEIIPIQDDTTLQVVFEKLAEILSRKGAEHVAIAAGPWS